LAEKNGPISFKIAKVFHPGNNDSARIVLSFFPNPPICWVKENYFFKFILKDMA